MDTSGAKKEAIPSKERSVVWIAGTWVKIRIFLNSFKWRATSEKSPAFGCTLPRAERPGVRRKDLKREKRVLNCPGAGKLGLRGEFSREGTKSNTKHEQQGGREIVAVERLRDRDTFCFKEVLISPRKKCMKGEWLSSFSRCSRLPAWDG